MELIFKFLNDYFFIVNIFFVLIIIFSEKKRPVYAIFWVILLILAPYTGFVFYLFFGLSFRQSRIIKKFYGKSFLSFNNGPDKKNSPLKSLKRWHHLIQYLEVAQAGVLTTYEDVTLFTSGTDFFSNLIQDISKAENSIHMEYFIFKDDKLGNTLFSSIIKKAKEGIKIKLILDGTNGLTLKKLKDFKNSGVEVELFSPSFFHWLKIVNIRANYRDHRKISIIDGQIGYIGGFNIGNEYIGKGNLGKWRDTAVRITGSTVNELEKEFSLSWNFIQKDSKENFIYPNFKVKNPHNQNYAQLVSSGPNFQLHTARDNFLKLVLEAKNYIFLETPYFVPDETLVEALKIAALSGVKVKIIIPDKPDHPFVYWINQSFARELSKYGIKFYRYSEGFIHSKSLLVDGEVVSLGTINFDYRSFYNNFEININFYGGDIIRENLLAFKEDLLNSQPLIFTQKNNNSILSKFKESIFRLLSPLF
ncbi:MAG: cardiolipin synthase [Fusobacteriaceae bacterium]